VNFSAYGKRTFNNLRANFVREIPREEFFNTYRRLHSLFANPERSGGRNSKPGAGKIPLQFIRTGF
jgi:hypothetical protein